MYADESLHDRTNANDTQKCIRNKRFDDHRWAAAVAGLGHLLVLVHRVHPLNKSVRRFI
jgi:hypothetical protein